MVARTLDLIDGLVAIVDVVQILVRIMISLKPRIIIDSLRHDAAQRVVFRIKKRVCISFLLPYFLLRLKMVGKGIEDDNEKLAMV